MGTVLKVYLDSQDYSSLSGEALSPPLALVKRQLLDCAQSGRVAFYFSAVAVCEAAPTGSHAVSYAIRRGDLLSDLCGGNALIDAGSLLRSEVLQLLSKGQRTFSAYAVDGRWFPRIELGAPPSLETQLSEVVAEEAHARGLPRQQRRALARRLMKKGQVRQSVRSSIETLDTAGVVREFCAKYPMKPQLVEPLRQYSQGKGRREDAEAALEDSLRDPRWLMRWFAGNPSLAVPISEMVRAPGRSVGAQSRQYVQSIEAYRNEMSSSGDSLAGDEHLSKSNWQTSADSMVVGLAARFAKHEDVDLNPLPIPADVAKYCPGLDAAVRSMASSMWDNIGGSRKEQPSDSQFPDALHAIYGPYVDVFRADAFMAPHIRRQVESHGTVVVSKLMQLPAAIELRLAENGAHGPQP